MRPAIISADCGACFFEGRALITDPACTIHNRTGTCRACGLVTNINLLDAKPEHGCDPETADFTRLECADCYGPGYLPGP